MRLVFRMMLLGLLGGGAPAGSWAAEGKVSPPPRPVRQRHLMTRIAPGRIPEASGIVASRKRPGVFWAHGDSGNASAITAFNTQGNILAEVHILEAPNYDWEDICADEAGHLYLGDIGDGGKHPVRTVYQIAEPDPLHPPTEPIHYQAKYAFHYPRGRRFDAEGLFHYAGHLYIVVKSRWPASALYRIEPPPQGEGLCTLKKVASLPVALVSAADASPDGCHLVLTSYLGLWVFPITGSATFVDASQAKVVNYDVHSRVEGCCFSGKDIVLMGEEGSVFRVTAQDIADQARLVIH